MNEDKSTNFDAEFRGLTAQCSKIIRDKYGMSVKYGKLPTELAHLRRYLEIYNKTEPEKHFTYFESLFAKYRNDIFKCLESDYWLLNNDVVVQLGAGNKKLADKCHDITIDLSDIYKIACDLRREVEVLIDEYGEAYIADDTRANLIKPRIIILHLLRIFYHLTEDDDHRKLGQLVGTLENELQVNRKTVIPSTSTSSSTSTGGSGIESIFNVAINCMKSMGLDPPSNIKAPTDQELINNINNAFNNPQVQGLLTGVADTFKDAKGLPDLLESVTKNDSLKDGISSIIGNIGDLGFSATPEPTIVPEETPDALKGSNDDVSVDENGMFDG